MRVMILIKSTEETEAGVMPSTEMITAMTEYNEQLVKAGIMLDGQGLHPTSRAKRVRFSGNETTVIDGPFTETKELIAGYWIWEVRSLDEAAEWVRRMPNPTGAESEVEIRQLFSAEDFAAELTPELREREERLAQQLAEQLKAKQTQS